MARCPICGFRIRGKNHEQGHHHQKLKKEIGPKMNTATDKKREPWSNTVKR